MSELRKLVYLQSRKNQNLEEIAFTLMVSSFFFELVKPPTFTRGSYHCEGTIRSRLHSVPVEQLLKRIENSIWTFVTDTENLGYYKPDYETCAVCHRYQKCVEFSVRLPTDPFTIYMQSTATARRKVSGFPQTISWFITQQHLAADFGTPNHGKTTYKPCEVCNALGPRPNLKRKSSNESSKKPEARKKPRDISPEWHDWFEIKVQLLNAFALRNSSKIGLWRHSTRVAIFEDRHELPLVDSWVLICTLVPVFDVQ